jgi:PII-like signaling protein
MSAPESTTRNGEELIGNKADFVRLRIYVGEDKRHGDRPLYQAIVRKAREQRVAGATILRGTQGFGRSTHLHTVDVLFSQDLPVVIEIVDSREKIEAFAVLLEAVADIGLCTCETVTVVRCGKLHANVSAP